MLRTVCVIKMSELSHERRAYPPWEVPILKLVHGGQVREDGYERCDTRVPEPLHEYQRLERRFGVNKETKISRVAEVYGGGDIGVARLAEAMSEALAEQAELDSRSDGEKERDALLRAREKIDADLDRLDRLRRVDGSGAESYRPGLGLERANAIRESLKGRPELDAQITQREQEIRDREAAVAAREQSLDARIAAIEAKLALNAPGTAPAEPTVHGEEQKPTAEASSGAAENESPQRARRRS